MIYLRANPLLREPLKPEHIKNRLLDHWSSDPGQPLVWIHLNRLIKKYDLNALHVSGHGAPATLANCYLEGPYSEIYLDKSCDEAGMLKFFRQFGPVPSSTATAWETRGERSAGDVQWMTAGSGILHQEMPKGDSRGRMHGFQLWANLPQV